MLMSVLMIVLALNGGLYLGTILYSALCSGRSDGLVTITGLIARAMA